MHYITKFVSLSPLFCIISWIYSDYSVENAFPNLSFVDPVGIYHAGDDSDKLYVVEQPGTIKIFSNDQSTSVVQTFLDLTPIVNQGTGYTEEGLLGLAFHPNYSENGYFYVNYTDYGPRRNVIARYKVSESNPDQADSESSLIILEVNQPYSNHNGGQMDFGADGYLYIIFGDGGSGGDPLGNGQDLSTLLGSLIRIDVDNPSNGLNYGIPFDNPFTAPLSVRDEIYAYGLRNMWRFSWDPITGLLWGADVGQYAWEEINIIYPGFNYGWNTMEGNHCYPAGTNCNSDGFELPVWDYSHSDGRCSITGGYVYRGNDILSLQGKYVYGDWCTGDIWAFTYSEEGVHSNEHLLTTVFNITSFGLDQNNELLICGNENIYTLSSDEEVGILGDMNQDGSINVLDIIISVNIILGALPNTYQMWSGDVNIDGVINVLDIVVMVNLILTE